MLRKGNVLYRTNRGTFYIALTRPLIENVPKMLENEPSMHIFIVSVLISLACVNVYMFYELRSTQTRASDGFIQVGGELDKLNEAAGQTDDRLCSLSGEIDTVKDEVQETRAALQKTITDLKTVRGDLGVQSGLIATNAGELKTLRELGERTYYEFDLTRSKKPQSVGPIQIRLRKTKRKRKRYSLDIWADDRKIKKRSKILLEPVQFYVIGSKLPYEIVVNKIDKNRVVGYLATPKAQPRRTVASASGG